MMNETDVLTRLKAQAVDEAPALTVQAEDVMRAGRRRQLTHRALGVGAGVAAAAAGVAVALTVTGGEQSARPEPTDETPSVVPEYVAHAMPAILKDAALTPFGNESPDWTEFRIDAFADPAAAQAAARPLPQPQWDVARSWVLSGTSADGSLLVSVSSHDSNIEGVSPETYCASPPGGIAATCEFTTWANGKSIVQFWAPTRDPGEQDASKADRWFTRVVKAYDSTTGYAVDVREAAPGRTVDEASERMWLTPEELVDVATNPILDLDGALPR